MRFNAIQLIVIFCIIRVRDRYSEGRKEGKIAATLRDIGAGHDARRALR